MFPTINSVPCRLNKTNTNVFHDHLLSLLLPAGFRFNLAKGLWPWVGFIFYLFILFPSLDSEVGLAAKCAVPRNFPQRGGELTPTGPLIVT